MKTPKKHENPGNSVKKIILGFEIFFVASIPNFVNFKKRKSKKRRRDIFIKKFEFFLKKSVSGTVTYVTQRVTYVTQRVTHKK